MCCALTSLQHGLPVYYCYSCSSPEQSPVAWRSWWSTNMSRTEQQCDICMKWTWCHDLRRCVKLCFGLWAAVWADDRCAFVASVFSLHEQRTGWNSRLGTERRWRAGGLFTIITRSRWRHLTDSGARPIGEPLSHQQHAIFGKWLHHRGTTADCGGRDFRRDFQFVVQKQDNE